MSKTLVLISDPEAGEEGTYNGNVIGMVGGVVEGEYDNDTVMPLIREYLEEDGDFDIKLTSPHPHDKDFVAMYEKYGVCFHIMELND